MVLLGFVYHVDSAFSGGMLAFEESENCKKKSKTILYRTLTEFADLDFHGGFFVWRLVFVPVDIFLIGQRVEHVVGVLRLLSPLFVPEN